MMQAGNVGGGGRGGDKDSPGRDSGRDLFQLSVNDLSSDEFKKAWLLVKELHDKELWRLQAKLTSLRKERLADGRWTGSIAKIKELTEQQKVLNDTINDLREQLKSKTCDRCSVNEAYKNKLQKEFYDIQQRNLKFIAELIEERNKLREENKRLSSEKVKPKQQGIPISFSDSDDDDFIPCTQKTMTVFSVKDPEEDTELPWFIKSILESNTDQKNSGDKKELQEISNPPIPFYSQELFEVPETPLEKTSSNDSKPNTGGTAKQKSSADVPLIYTQGAQKEFVFQSGLNSLENKIDQPKKKCETKATETSTQKRETRIDFSWSLSSISPEDRPIKIVSETSEENMPQKRSPCSPPPQKKENLSVNNHPKSGRKRSTWNIPTYNVGFKVRDNINQILSSEQPALKMINKSTDAKSAGIKPQSDIESVYLGSVSKRKIRIQSEKRK